jgi:hypothetical protein
MVRKLSLWKQNLEGRYRTKSLSARQRRKQGKRWRQVASAERIENPLAGSPAWY